MAEPEYVRALDRGLAVLCAFSAQQPVLTVTEVAAATDLTRATARRLLHTLERLGYVRAKGRGYELTPRVLAIGYSYISSLGIAGVVTTHIEALAARIREPVTVGTLDGAEYVVVARANSDRFVTVQITIGSRLPAHVSSLGKALLAHLDPAELDAFFAVSDLERFTDTTITDEAKLREELEKVRERGWATSDQELEEGLVSVGAPLRNGQGQVIAAVNTSSHAGRITLAQMEEQILPSLLNTAAAISADLAHTT